jgi:hypothetical protein
VFGIDEPLPGGSGQVTDARIDGHDAVVDGPATLMPGLLMHVESGVALWTNDQPPEVAWAQTNDAVAKADVWTGAGPDVANLVFSGEIDTQNPFSVWMEGQVYAPQGTQQLQIKAADYAFFDVELVPNSGSFQQIVSARNDNLQMRSIAVPAAGWYRVRVGWASSPATADFSVLHEGPPDPSFVAFTTTSLRH